MATRSKLGDFEIISRLGAGSFGTVFKVRRFIDSNLYVIKNVRIVELTFKEQSEAINEVQILAQLKSPYVVRYYDSFIEDNSLHIGNCGCDVALVFIASDILGHIV
jgi:NIMA (never in mitosis gene a)-related kinase